MNPTDYSIYCPEANQKKIVERYFDKLGYEPWASYTGSENNSYDCFNFYKIGGRKYYDDCKKDQIGNVKLLTFSEWQSMVEEAPRKIVGWKLIKEYPGLRGMQGKIFDETSSVFPYCHNWNEFWQPVYSEPRTPVVELPDENGSKIKMFSGDKVWYVQNDFYVGWGIAQNVDLSNTYRTYFATEAAAIKFVRESKPVYPESLVDALLKSIDGYNYEGVKSAIEKLNQFK